jgi:hypothetical protein
MADEQVGLLVKVKVHGEQQLRKLKREIKSLNDHITMYQNRVNNTLNSADTRWKKHFDQFDAMVKMMGGALTKFVTASAKFAAIQLGAMGAAMMGVHAAFVLGNASMKAFRYLAKGVAAGLAAVTVAASTAAAAIRENQAAMFAYKGVGKSEFGSGLNQVRQEMRAMARDTNLAGLSAKDLQAIYSEISKKGVYTQSSQALVKGLMDFGAAGQDVAKGAQSVGALVAMLQDPKATFSGITKSAKDLGPAMETALSEAKKKGIDTVAELKAAILDGTLAVMGGVNGQFAAVNDTLIGRFKKAMGIIKADFADFGQIFLTPAKDTLTEVQHIIRRTLIQVSGTLAKFGQGPMMNGLIGVFDKLSRGFGDMINKYVPKAEGMLSGIADWWGRFKQGWNDVLDKLRPYIDSAKIIENMLMNIIRPLFDQFGMAMSHTRDLIMNNKDAFEEFGTRIGAFISAFGQFAGAVREVFVQALPFINQIVDGATKLFQLFTGILGKLKGISGGFGSGGAFALATGLYAAGRGMKNTIGGVVRDYTKEMNVSAGTVVVNGGGFASGGGMQSHAGGGDGFAPVGTPGTGMYGAPLPGGMRSQQGGGPTGVTPQGGGRHVGYTGNGLSVHQMPGGGIKLFTPGGRELTRKDAGYWKAMTSPLSHGYSTSVKGVDPTRLGKLRGMNPFGRAGRTTAAYARVMGNKELGIKGFNQSGGAMIGTTLGLNLLSAVAPESSKGAISLGSAVGAFNPMAGLAIAGLGSAATGTNAGFGALSGAMGGAAAGMMVGGVPGALVGALMGAIAGGIMGAINKRKEDARLARQAGEAMALNIQSEIMGGVNSAISISRNQIAGQARLNIENQIKQIGERNRTGFKELYPYLSMTKDEINAAVAYGGSTGTGPFANLSYEQQKDLRGNPQEFIASAMRTFEISANAAETTFKVYESRMSQYTEIFGMNSDQIFEMSRQSGLNLMDATINFNSAVQQLTSSLISNTIELNTFIGETFANMYDIVDVAKKAAEAPQIYDEAARTLYDKKLAGTLTGSDINDFLSTALQQFPAMYANAPGGQLRGLIEFVRSFQPGGTAYGFGPNGEQLPLTGAGELANMPVTQQILQTGKAGIARAGQELLVSGLAGSGLQLTDQETLRNFGARFEALATGSQEGADLAAYIANTISGFDDRRALAATPEERQSIQTEFQNFIATALPAVLGDFGTVAFEAAASSLEVQADATYRAIVDAFAPGFNLTAESATISSPNSTMVNATGSTTIMQPSQDTKLSKSKQIGDTATNLSRTLDAHNRLNSGAGNRFITSSYRNFALGSSNSDHINGRAYDLIGDNLISYRDAVRRDGGFAEFHGKNSSRHLHVVPRIGDAISPAYSASMAMPSITTSQTPESNIYNITVNGAGSNPEEIANLVVHKIKNTEKINRERSY